MDLSPAWLGAGALVVLASGLVLFAAWAFTRRSGAHGPSLEGEEQLGALLDHLPLALLVQGADGTILRVNTAFEDLFGYASEEVLGHRNDGFLTVPEDRPLLRGLASQLRESGAGVAEFRGLRKDGSTFWIRASAQRADELGRGVRLLIGEDITEIREAQGEAHLARDRYRELVESASDLVWSVDADGRWTFLNSATREIYGVKAEEIVGGHFTDHSAPTHREGDERALRRLLQGDDDWTHETVHVTAEGQEIHLEFSGRVVTEEGLVVGARGTARDVSAHVASREALTDVVRQQSLIQTFLAATPDIIFFKDQHGVYRGCNEAFARLVGRSVGEIVGKTDHDLSSRDLADHYAHGDREAYEAGRPVTIPSWEVLPSGESVYLETIKAPFFDPDGEPLGIVGVARDATERKRREEALEAQVDEAREAGRRKSAFLAGLSHDIRTPLNGVLGMTELLLDAELTPPQRTSAELIRSSARALLAVLNDVLDLSRLQAGSLELERVAFELPRVVEGAAGALGVRALDKGDEILVDVGPEVPRWVTGDAGRLRQVLTKLLESSIRFTEKGAVVVRARKVEGGESAGVAFSVTDTGTGIPPAQLKALLQGLLPGKDSDGTLGGVGLGLSLARELVERMGGTLDYASRSGGGNEFSFRVPLPEAGEAASAPLRLVRLEGASVLVVDDNPVNRRILKEFLEAAGARAEEAPGADAAMARIRARREEGQPFNALLIDSLMPGKDGFQLAAMVRAEASLADLPIVMATSAGDPDQETRAREVGVDGVLTKPVSRSEILATLSAALGREEQGDSELITPGSVERSIPRRDILIVHDEPEWRTAAASLLRDRGHHVQVVETLDALTEGAWDLVFLRLGPDVAAGLEAARGFREAEAEKRPVLVGFCPPGVSRDDVASPGGPFHHVWVEPVERHDLLGIVEGWGSGRASQGAEPPSRPPGEGGSEDLQPPRETREPEPDALAAAGPGGDRAPLDLAALEMEMEKAGLASAVPRVLSGFQEEARRRLQQLDQAVAEDRCRSAAQVARAYRTVAIHVHAHPLAEVLSRVEAAGRRGDKGRLQNLTQQVSRIQEEVFRVVGEQVG